MKLVRLNKMGEQLFPGLYVYLLASPFHPTSGCIILGMLKGRRIMLGLITPGVFIESRKKDTIHPELIVIIKKSAVLLRLSVKAWEDEVYRHAFKFNKSACGIMWNFI